MSYHNTRNKSKQKRLFRFINSNLATKQQNLEECVTGKYHIFGYTKKQNLEECATAKYCIIGYKAAESNRLRKRVLAWLFSDEAVDFLRKRFFV